MEDESRTFYLAVIVACLVGIAFVTHAIVTSPKYEEHYTELYFTGEKVLFDADGRGMVGGREAYLLDGGMVIVDGVEVLGPLYRGDTFVLDGISWNLEDASASWDEAMVRAFPVTAAPGTTHTISFAIVNHRRGDEATYTYTVGAGGDESTGTVTLAKNESAVITAEVTVPFPPAEEEPLGQYDELFSGYVRHVTDYGNAKLVTVAYDDGSTAGPYWRVRVAVTLSSGNSIHFWIRLDDE